MLTFSEMKDAISCFFPNAEFTEEGCFESEDGTIHLQADGYTFCVSTHAKDDKLFKFNNILRQAFVQEYRHMGLEWELVCATHGTEIVSIEKRQKLTTFNDDVAPDEILKKTAMVNWRVEKRLEFSHLMAQLFNKGNFEHIKKVGIARDCPFSNKHYSPVKSEAVCLSDSAWFLALVDHKNRWNATVKTQTVPVSLSYGNFFFTDMFVFDEIPINSVAGLFKPSAKWWLFDQADVDIKKTRERLTEELACMMKRNLEIAVKKVPVDVKTDDDFFDVETESRRNANNS